MSAVTMETIFRDMITLVGYEKALEILNQAKPKEQVVVAKPEEKKEEEKRRIPRMTPTISGHLKTEFEKVKVELTDKLKKEFVSYVNNLTENDFASKGLIDHMRDFANTKKPTTEVTVKTEEKPKKEKNTKKVTVVKAEEQKKEEKVKSNASNAAGITQVSLKELQDNINLVTTDYTAKGTYLNTETDQIVTGPDHEDDEWLDPVEFNGKNYMVSSRSGRVYESPEGDGYDIFHGFVGVGQFSAMKMSKK